MNFNTALATALKLTVEDNAQVEVNFNIDTDENGSPKDTQDESGDDNTTLSDENDDELNEAEKDTNIADREVEQLQEAQNSLESLMSTMLTHSENGTHSKATIESYATTLNDIIPKSVIDKSGAVSMENRAFSSTHHAGLIAITELEEINATLNQVSMEARFDWLKKAAHKVAVVFKAEEALIKRAKALRVIADTSSGEHASSKNIVINSGRKHLKLNILPTDKWSSDAEFLSNVDKFTHLYNSFNGISDVSDENFTDKMFPESKRWKAVDGNPTYTMFGMKLIRKDKVILGQRLTDDTDKDILVNIKPATCKSALTAIITMLEHGRVMSQTLETMLDVLEDSAQVELRQGRGLRTTRPRVTTKVTYPDGYETMYRTLVELAALKNRTVTELLNYINYSLTDREFV